jgi:polyisoprenoid-binding protein YceI
MQKALFVLLILGGLGLGVYLYAGHSWSAKQQPVDMPATTTPDVPATLPPPISAIEPGTYAVVVNDSLVNWSILKPLVEGDLTTGTIPVASGTVQVASSTITGAFILDMNNLRVGLTQANLGEEGALEEQLRKVDFFDVETFPTAEFSLATATPHADVASTYLYDISGTLTMKGISNDITFPAVLQKEGDNMVARAHLEIDRTKWGIKLGSTKFFTDLGNNVIDDIVPIDVVLVARPVVDPSAVPEDALHASSTATTSSTDAINQ